MNNDANKPKQSDQPSHEAAKVVIPFDIDMSEVDKKLDELERRVSKIKIVGVDQSQMSFVTMQTGQTAYETRQQDLRQERLIDIETQAQKEEEKNQTMIMASLSRVADLLRQINDTVLLMYSQIMSGRNNA